MLKVVDSGGPVTCWSCSAAHIPSTFFCPHCSKIQPAPGGDYFSVFAFEPRLNIDLSALEQEFHRLSRKLHPDRYVRASEREKAWSLADSALLNDAYRTLRDPLRRSEYLLKLEGAEIGEKHSGRERRDPACAPADLLEEVFELNLQLEEMRATPKAGAADPDLKKKLSQARMKFERLLEEVDRELREQWTAWDEGNDTARLVAQKQMVALLDRRRYLHVLVREVNEGIRPGPSLEGRRCRKDA